MIEHACGEILKCMGEGLADCLFQCIGQFICEPWMGELCCSCCGKKTEPEGMSTTHLASLKLTSL